MPPISLGTFELKQKGHLTQRRKRERGGERFLLLLEAAMDDEGANDWGDQETDDRDQDVGI